MARNILRGGTHLPMHDLESFYWLLAWVTLRHVEHNKSLDPLIQVFDNPDAMAASMLKFAWLHEVVDVGTNKPLTQLLGQLARLLLDSSGMDHDKDYDTMLRIFEDALGSKWPQGDRCISFTPSKSNKFESGIGGTRTSKKRKYQSQNPPKMAPSEDAEENAQKVVDNEEPSTKRSKGSHSRENKVRKNVARRPGRVR
jgi:hypothetical protein